MIVQTEPMRSSARCYTVSRESLEQEGMKQMAKPEPIPTPGPGETPKQPRCCKGLITCNCNIKTCKCKCDGCFCS